VLAPSAHGFSDRFLVSEKGSDPLEASPFYWFYGLTGEGQTPFRIGSKLFWRDFKGRGPVVWPIAILGRFIGWVKCDGIGCR
jgi:hypothetical protein